LPIADLDLVRTRTDCLVLRTDAVHTD
jgi:hypothetical protein